MDTSEFWLIKAMDIDYPRVTILERRDTYAEVNDILMSIDEDARQHLMIVAVTPIKRGTGE